MHRCEAAELRRWTPAGSAYLAATVIAATSHRPCAHTVLALPAVVARLFGDGGEGVAASAAPALRAASRGESGGEPCAPRERAVRFNDRVEVRIRTATGPLPSDTGDSDGASQSGEQHGLTAWSDSVVRRWRSAAFHLAYEAGDHTPESAWICGQAHMPAHVPQSGRCPSGASMARSGAAGRPTRRRRTDPAGARMRPPVSQRSRP